MEIIPLGVCLGGLTLICEIYSQLDEQNSRVRTMFEPCKPWLRVNMRVIQLFKAKAWFSLATQEQALA